MHPTEAKTLSKAIRSHLQNLSTDALTKQYKRLFRGIDRTRRLYTDLLKYVFSFFDAATELSTLREVCRYWSNVARPKDIPDIFTNKVYDSMFLGKIKNESWLATNVIYSSYPLLPNIRTLVDNCGFGPPVHDIAENSNITIEVGTIDAWEIESQKIASISTYTGVGTTSVFPNCVALHIKKICEPKGILDLKRFPALTVLDCVHDSYQSLDVVGDTSQLKEVILGRFGPLSLNQVATAVYGTTNIGEPSRIKRLEKIDMSGNSNFNFFTDVAYFKNLVTLSCSRVNRDVLAQLHNLRFLTVSFRDIYSKSIPDPFKHIPPLPNLEQLCMKLDMRLDMWGPVQHYIRRVRLPPWLATMRKLNKLSIDSEIINPEFIPRKLFFIQELVVHHRTRTILESFVCDIGIPILRNMFKFSSV